MGLRIREGMKGASEGLNEVGKKGLNGVKGFKWIWKLLRILEGTKASS